MNCTRPLQIFLSIFALCFAAACGSANVTGEDAGSRPPDGGIRTDAGAEVDAGVGADGGGDGLDAGQDGGSEGDAGMVPDGGPVSQLVVSVSSGIKHTCAVVQAGDVYCWGSNESGQAGQPTGDGGVASLTEPTRVPDIVDAVAVVAGGNHTCVRHASGTASCWGQNAFGQLGDGTLEGRGTVDVVDGLTDALNLSAGIYNSCAQTSAGEAHCWGNRAGDPNFARDTAPLKVEGLTHPVVSLSSGGEFSCASLSTGNVACWGVNSDGQLGDGTSQSRPTAANVSGLTQVGQVAAGSSHACAVRLGEVWCWGSNMSAALGTGSNSSKEDEPVQIPGLTDVTLVAAGFQRTCAVRADESLVCWGYNPATMTGDASPVGVAGLSNIVQVSVGTGGHICAIATNGTGRAGLYCWGRNDHRQATPDAEDLVAAPTQVIIP